MKHHLLIDNDRTRAKKITALKMLIAIASVGVIGIVASYTIKISLCPFFDIFGIPCPTCGMTRAFKRFFVLDIVGALSFNPMFWLVPFVPLLPLVGAKFGQKVEDICVVVTILLFFVAWIVRMILFYPHTEPMIHNPNALINF